MKKGQQDHRVITGKTEHDICTSSGIFAKREIQ